MTAGPDGPQEVTLLDESGDGHRFLVHDAIESDGRTYYLVEAADDPEQVLLLRETEGGLESVAEDELERVLALLQDEDPDGPEGESR